METIEIKDVNGVVLFSHTAEDNTITLTVETAVACGVSLAKANLAGACLAGADLEGAKLEWANLEDANLAWADLADAILIGANLEDTNIKDANLKGAFLIRANLKGANLAWANLEGVLLYGAKLHGANLSGAKLYGADLNGAKNIPFIPLSCPEEGAFVAWKKVDGYFLVKIQIPEDARRTSATTRKCRCDKAMVLDITSLDGEEHYNEVTNNNYKETVYKVGEIVYPDSFDENRWNECSHGIHFFVNKEDAINY